MVRVHGGSGELEILDDSGALRWSGKPLGYDVSVALAIPGSGDAIVLLNPDARMAGFFRNLLRVSVDGSVVWRAELPERQGDDAYVAVQWSGGQLVANTWSTHRVRLEVDTGRIIDAVFTK